MLIVASFLEIAIFKPNKAPETKDDSLCSQTLHTKSRRSPGDKIAPVTCSNYVFLEHVGKMFLFPFFFDRPDPPIRKCNSSGLPN